MDAELSILLRNYEISRDPLDAIKYVEALLRTKRQPKSLWDNNFVQFTRLLAEINAVGLDEETEKLLCYSMDTRPEHIQHVLDAADEEWENIKKLNR